MYATYLHFYDALSHEGIARQMHHLSATKIQRLEKSKESFERAAASLPKPNIVNDDVYSNSTLSPSEADDSVSLDDSVSSFDATSPQRNALSPYFDEFDEEAHLDYQLKPVPLQIRKAVQPGYRSVNPQATTDDHSQITMKAIPRQERPLSMASEVDIRITPPMNGSASLNRDGAIRRYYEQLQNVSQALAKHIMSIDDLIQTTQKAQYLRRASPNLQSNDETIHDANIQARILKLRSKKWERERFNPKRYQNLCEAALNEL